MSPASIFATRFATAKASTSQRATERRFGMTRLSPSSMPPYPAHRPMCVTALEVSMSCLVVGYGWNFCPGAQVVVGLDPVVLPACRLDAAVGDGLGHGGLVLEPQAPHQPQIPR